MIKIIIIIIITIATNRLYRLKDNRSQILVHTDERKWPMQVHSARYPRWSTVRVPTEVDVPITTVNVPLSLIGHHDATVNL